MTPLSKTLGACALCILLGSSSGVSAQAGNTARKRVPTNRASDELNHLLASAQESVDKQDYETAAQDYRDYLAKKPDDAIVHYDLGYVYSAMQRPEDAEIEYEEAIALDPTNPKIAPAYQNLGLTLLPTDPAAAIEPLQHVVDLMPEDARAKWLLGSALDGAGKTALAIEQYEAAEKLDENDPDIRVSLGSALLRSGRVGEAETNFREALALHPAVGPASQAHKELALALIAQKHLEAGAAELASYLEAQPNDADMRVERASVLVDLGKDDEALAELERAATVGPENLHALKLRSQIYYHAKRFDDAIPVLQKAAAIAPRDPDIPARLGRVYLEKKVYADAIRQLLAAHDLDPKANDILSDLMTAEYMSKDYAIALQVLDTLAKRTELPAPSWFIRAVCYDKLGQPAQALDAYQRFLHLNKDENNDMYFESAVRVRVLTRELQEKKR
jgi:protein O-GlcNAc transferase